MPPTTWESIRLPAAVDAVCEPCPTTSYGEMVSAGDLSAGVVLARKSSAKKRAPSTLELHSLPDHDCFDVLMSLFRANSHSPMKVVPSAFSIAMLPALVRYGSPITGCAFRLRTVGS